ncbi:MAG TPA: helicase-related protein, partial [Acidobacteriota bacterium]|nr:helicase-related protein [Acidobacteriota bacterium]
RLPSALDNRPLNFEEFENRVHQTVYVSATPGPYELQQAAGRVVEQIVRPTGLLDPVIHVRPVKGQIDDLYAEVRRRAEAGERTLVTTLTKKMAEDLTDYLRELGVRVAYLHSEIETLDRMKILRDLRLGVHDVLVGINLLREGLDLPEVSLVAVLDADQEGFLRSATALIQTMGRAARHLSGTVILYADAVTDSMATAMRETQRRREIQEAFNRAHGITPQSIVKPLDEELVRVCEADYVDLTRELPATKTYRTTADLERDIAATRQRMIEAAGAQEFERAAALRDRMRELQELLLAMLGEEE